MQKPMKKYALALAIASTSFLAGCGDQQANSEAAAAALPAVTVAEVLHERFTEWDEFTGRLQAPETVRLMPRVSGYIERVRFQEGSYVKKGDILFSIDSTPFDTEVQRLKGDLQDATAAARLASQDYDRAVQLAEQRAISKETLDNRLTQKQQTSAQLASVQAELARAELDVTYTEVTAPIDGRVSYAQITEGNFVTAGQTELTRVVSTEAMYAYFDLDEQTYLRYNRLAEEGQRADTRDSSTPVYMGLVDGSDYPFQGRIDFVDNQIDRQTGTIRVRARFDNSNHQLIPGLFARIRLTSSDPHQGILIDNKAIGTDLNNKYVLVVDSENTLQYRPVALGEQVHGLRVITQGLSPGDLIVTAGLQRVRPTMQIDPQIKPMTVDDTLVSIHTEQEKLDRDSAELNRELTLSDARG